MSYELRDTNNSQVKLVMAHGETVGELARTKSGWLFRQQFAVWSNLPPRIAAEAKAFVTEKCAILNITRRLMS